jgi:hypothetical protein
MLGQEKRNAEVMVKKVSEALTAARRAVIDQAKEMRIPDSVTIGLAGGDPRRAKAIWIKLQLKRNFPTTFNEAARPFAYTGNTLLAAPLPPGDLPPLDTFVKALTTVQQQYPGYVWGKDAQDEMAALLLLSLSVNRRGATFDAEQVLGAGALPADVDMGLRKIVDVWGEPLAFFRFPTDYNGQNTFSAINQVDDQDPEQTLLNSTWQGAYGPLFQQHCHVLGTAQSPVPLYPMTVASSGRNRKIGLLLAGAASPNFGMSVLVPVDENDNIYSYNIR